jgi:hypothetical protein
MPQEQADALAEGLHESLKDSYVTNEKLDVALAKLRTEADSLDRRHGRARRHRQSLLALQ